jgi:hypothetical protein
MHIQYEQIKREPAHGIHMKNLYRTINRHVTACNGNYFQVIAMLDITEKHY